MILSAACKDNYILAELFAEGRSHDESLMLEPGEIMMEVLFGEHSAPIEVEIDHEVSFSTQSLINHLKNTPAEVVEENNALEGEKNEIEQAEPEVEAPKVKRSRRKPPKVKEQGVPVTSLDL